MEAKSKQSASDAIRCDKVSSGAQETDSKAKLNVSLKLF